MDTTLGAVATHLSVGNSIKLANGRDKSTTFLLLISVLSCWGWRGGVARIGIVMCIVRLMGLGF